MADGASPRPTCSTRSRRPTPWWPRPCCGSSRRWRPRPARRGRPPAQAAKFPRVTIRATVLRSVFDNKGAVVMHLDAGRTILPTRRSPADVAWWEIEVAGTVAYVRDADLAEPGLRPAVRRGDSEGEGQGQGRRRATAGASFAGAGQYPRAERPGDHGQEGRRRASAGPGRRVSRRPAPEALDLAIFLIGISPIRAIPGARRQSWSAQALMGARRSLAPDHSVLL